MHLIRGLLSPMFTCSRRTLPVTAVLALAGLASSQERLIGTGDVLPQGTVTFAVDPVLNASGSWAAIVGLDSGLVALVRDGAVVQLQGDSVPGIPGATIASLTSFDMNDAGEIASIAILDGVPAETSYVVLFQGRPVVRVGDPVGVPELAPGTAYGDFSSLDLNNQREILLRGSWTGAHHLLALLDVAADGTLLSTSHVASKLKPVASTGLLASWIGGAGTYALSDSGDIVYYVEGVNAEGWHWVAMRNTTVLFEGGGATPIPGWTWWPAQLLGYGLTLNASGQAAWAWKAESASGPNQTIVVASGAKIAADGDTPVDLDGSPVTPWTTPPAYANDGTVAWTAAWSSASSSSSGLFVDDRLLVATGDTIDGRVVSSFQASEGLAIQSGGEGVAVHMILDGIHHAVYRFDVAASATAMASCAGNPGELSIGGGSAAAGGALTLAMDQAQATGAIPLLAFAPQAAPSWPACGTLVPGIGELLIDVSSPNAIVVLGGPAWSGAPSAFQLPVPYDLFGSTLFAQGLFVDLAGSAPGEPFRATDGLRLFLGL